jgi:hypothetical protein
MNPQCKDIKTILVDEAIALASSIHLTRMPESPDSVITIIDQPGSPPESMLQYYKPMVQVIVRGERNSYEATKTIADDILTCLHAYGPLTIDDTNYVGIWATSDVIPLGYDKSDRPIFSVNFMIHRSVRRI